MTDIIALKQANAARWAKAKLTRSSEFNPVAARLVAAKSRYQNVSARTGVPWYFIAVVHEREASQDWNANLAQGDPWNRVSVHVPKGRGPFKSWEDAAVDALTNCAPYASRNKNWTVGSLLTLLEAYNGYGYANRGLPSPYVWSGTDQYVKGKYVSDGVFDPNAVDKQLGCAGLLLVMSAIDPSINLGATPVIQPVTVTPIATPIATPATTPADHAKVGGAVVATTAAAGAVAASQSGVSATEILLWIGGLSAVAIAAFIIGYRIVKGHWPWTSISTGNQSPALLPLSPQLSGQSLALDSAQSALQLAASPATPSPKSSASRPRQPMSGRPSRKTPTRRKSSKTSKRSVGKKSSHKRTSKSRN